jgi:hypothetical protein
MLARWLRTIDGSLEKISELRLSLPSDSFDIMREPAELDIPTEIPSILPAIMKAHLNELGFSREELVVMLNVHEPEFLEMYGQFVKGDSVKPRLRIVS